MPFRVSMTRAAIALVLVIGLGLGGSQVLSATDDIQTFTIDRFEGDWVVLIPHDASDTETRVPATDLPPDIQEGDIIHIRWDGNRIVSAQRDPAATERARATVRDLIERLTDGQ